MTILPEDAEMRRQSAIGRKYGWRPELPSIRDLTYAVARAPATLPDKVDMRPLLGPCYDQRQIGRCTGAAWAGAVEFDLRRQPPTGWFQPSMDFIYYCERVIEGTVHEDAGAQIRDGAKALAKLGVCSETEWPSRDQTYTLKPSPEAYARALKTRALNYYRVPQDINHIRGCLAEGFPIVAGFTVYTSFESMQVASDGLVPMPRLHEKELGGHAILIVGYNDHTRRLIVRNSWGMWGDRGYCFFPYDYFTNPRLSSDFWTLRLVSA